MSGCLRWGVPESGALPSQMADKRRLTGMDELSRVVWMVWSDHCTGCSRQLFVDELGGIVDELGRMVDELVTRPGFRGNCPIPAAPTHDGFFKVVFSQPQTTTEPTITGTCETPTPSTSNPMKNVGVSHSVSHIHGLGCLTCHGLSSFGETCRHVFRRGVGGGLWRVFGKIGVISFDQLRRVGGNDINLAADFFCLARLQAAEAEIGM